MYVHVGYPHVTYTHVVVALGNHLQECGEAWAEPESLAGQSVLLIGQSALLLAAALLLGRCQRHVPFAFSWLSKCRAQL